MIDDEGRQQEFALLTMAMNYQALYGLLVIGGLILAAVMWGDRTAFALGIVSGAVVLVSQVIVARSVTARSESGFRVAQLLWYAAFVFGAGSFGLLAF